MRGRDRETSRSGVMEKIYETGLLNSENSNHVVSCF